MRRLWGCARPHVFLIFTRESGRVRLQDDCGRLHLRLRFGRCRRGHTVGGQQRRTELERERK